MILPSSQGCKANKCLSVRTRGSTANMSVHKNDIVMVAAPRANMVEVVSLSYIF